MSSSASVKLRYEKCLQVWGNANASIGAWVIWRELGMVWGSIIALSQIIAAISPHLPYRERLKNYSSMLHDFEEIFIQSESKWHDISAGKFSEEEINKARKNLRLLKQKSLKKHMSNSVIPDDSAKATKAEDLAHCYFATFYPT
jgi:hypothetical protein